MTPFLDKTSWFDCALKYLNMSANVNRRSKWKTQITTRLPINGRRCQSLQNPSNYHSNVPAEAQTQEWATVVSEVQGDSWGTLCIFLKLKFVTVLKVRNLTSKNINQGREWWYPVRQLNFSSYICVIWIYRHSQCKYFVPIICSCYCQVGNLARLEMKEKVETRHKKS